MNRWNHQNIAISVEHGDALEYRADVLILKFAKAHFGVDSVVSSTLIALGESPESFRPSQGMATIVDSRGALGVSKVLIIGVDSLWEFGYKQIRTFARTSIKELNRRAPTATHICLTLHGVGYGLDEIEAFHSEIAGFVDAITEGDAPKSLKQITIVDVSERRVENLKVFLKRILPSGAVELDIKDYLESLEEDASETFRTVGYTSDEKPHVFVAMPFKDEMEDIYEYGIQNVVRKCGYICERADLASFTGDVMDWVKRRISNAALVIADLTYANPNVYLEVGYAWGVGVKTVLLVNDAAQLKFDVKGQRCLTYKRIKHLEQSLEQELVALSENNLI
jgi:hypothetical protein